MAAEATKVVDTTTVMAEITAEKKTDVDGEVKMEVTAAGDVAETKPAVDGEGSVKVEVTEPGIVTMKRPANDGQDSIKVEKGEESEAKKPKTEVGGSTLFLSK